MKLTQWLRQSNRWKHLMGGCIIGLGANGIYCAAYSGILTAAALEFKDKAWGGKWDWTDLTVTIAGTAIGYLARTLLLTSIQQFATL